MTFLTAILKGEESLVAAVVVLSRSRSAADIALART